MKIVTGSEAQKIEKNALGAQSSSSFFMDNVAEAIGQWIQKKYSKEKNIIFLCGSGNNGGDGYSVALRLLEANYKNLQIYFSKPVSRLAQEKFDLVKTSHPELLISMENCEFNVFFEKCERAQLLVDAIFGLGLSLDIDGIWREIIKKTNQSVVPVLSIDLPSGLDATEGFTYGPCIQADWTACVLPLKSGLFMNSGPLLSGEIIPIDANFPKSVVEQNLITTRCIGKNSCQKIRPQRKVTSNKTHFGHLCIIGGSKGMRGAAESAGLAALRSGAGYASILSDNEKQKFPPEFLIVQSQTLKKNIVAKKYNAFVIGPGLEAVDEHLNILKLILSSKIPVVLDAGGFDLVKKKKLFPVPLNWILTPHAGELSRLISVSAKEIERKRILFSSLAQKKLGGVLLLKGFHTLVRTSSKNYIINSGNPALAKAGTGDVLAGIIGSFLAQGLSPVKAACLGAFIHGDCADQWLRDGHSIHSLLPTDIIEMLKDY